MSFLKIVLYVVLAYFAIRFVVGLTLSLLALLFPLLIVAGIGYVLYRIINNKCVSHSHRLFH